MALYNVFLSDSELAVLHDSLSGSLADLGDNLDTPEYEVLKSFLFKFFAHEF